VLGVEWSNVHLAGAFIIGAIFATIVTLRIVRFVVDYFTGVERRRPRRRRPYNQDE
jgi:hypothetical protein